MKGYRSIKLKITNLLASLISSDIFKQILIWKVFISGDH